MRTLSLVLVGLLLVALIHQSEAGSKKQRKKCKDKEVDEGDEKDVQAIEDCLAKKMSADPAYDMDQATEDCTTPAAMHTEKGKCHGKTKFFDGMKKKVGKVVDKVKGFFGKGKDGKDGISKLKEGLGKIKEKAKAAFQKFKGKGKGKGKKEEEEVEYTDEE